MRVKRTWHNKDFENLEEQPMDPPEEYSSLDIYWK
jgi:hypothetical protein